MIVTVKAHSLTIVGEKTQTAVLATSEFLPTSVRACCWG
jgi:hypothetical protein